MRRREKDVSLPQKTNTRNQTTRQGPLLRKEYDYKQISNKKRFLERKEKEKKKKTIKEIKRDKTQLYLYAKLIKNMNNLTSQGARDTKTLGSTTLFLPANPWERESIESLFVSSSVQPNPSSKVFQS